MAPRPRRRALTALAATTLAPVLVPALGATPAAAVTDVDVDVVLEGLDAPRGMDFAPDGALYVAEAGSGGEGPCVPALGDEACLGLTGAVTRIDPATGTSERVVEGLPSLALEGESIGPSDVAVTDDGRLLVTIGLGADPAVREQLGEDGALLATLVSVDPETGAVTQVADLGDFEAAENPDEDLPDSNPNSVLVRGEQVLVADAGANAVVAVAADGTVSTVAVFPEREVPGPGGAPVSMDAVPTSLAEGPDGQVLVGQLTGFPFPQGGALVWALDPDQPPVDPEEFAGGFTNIIDVEQREDDTFVLEIATNSLLAGPDAVGALARLRPDGTTQRVLQDVLRFPGGMDLAPDGRLFLSNLSVGAPGQGQVLAIDPSLAGDPAIQSACPPDDVAFPPFTDIASSVHEEAIACLWWWQITQGTADGDFDPGAALTRGQTASLLVRAAQQTSITLPPTAPDAFDDDEGSVHEQAINLLAAAGIMLGDGGRQVMPGAEVSRAQLAALAVRAAETILGAPLPAGDDAFTDDEGSPLEAEINAAAAAGWLVGNGAGLVDPDASVTRAQASSILTRAMSDLVDAGQATLPDPVAPN